MASVIHIISSSHYITAAWGCGTLAWAGLSGCHFTATLNHVVVFDHNKLWQFPDGNSFSVTSQVLWPKTTTNCGDLWPWITFLWPLKCIIWSSDYPRIPPQDPVVDHGMKYLFSEYKINILLPEAIIYFNWPIHKCSQTENKYACTVSSDYLTFWLTTFKMGFI